MEKLYVGQDILVYGQRTKIKEITQLGSVGFEKSIRLPNGSWIYYLTSIDIDGAIKPLNIS